MQEYYFLFALALIWTIFATIQDLKTREVSNWLNFSLIAFALAYRAFYAITTNNTKFFTLGLAGFGIFFILGHAFYYSKIFAGGDAKLLMGFGIILPYTTYASLFTLSLLFIFLLLTVGAIYSILYSVFIIIKHKQKFKKEFSKKFKKSKTTLTITIVLFLASLSLGTIFPLAFVFAPLFIIPLIFIYTKSLDKCMIFLTPAKKLTEGDWLENSIKINNKTIKKTVHGLSLKDIKLLRKHNRSVLIKQGIPFVPAFLISLIITIIWFLKFSSFSFLLFNF